MAQNHVDDSVRGVFWAYVSFVSTKLLNLVAIVILARYLSPAEFGLMAICIAVMGYFEIVSQFGLGSALISAREAVEETASAVFICALLISGTLAGVLLGVSGYIAAAYDQPIIEEIFGFIGFGLIIHALTAVNTSFLYRELRLRDKVIPDVVRGLSKGLVSIALAVLGFGVWSLVYGYLASAIAGSICLMIIRPWRPTRWPTFRAARSALRFGSHLLVAETVNSTPRLLDNLLIGKILGASALGVYSLAYRIPELAIKTFTNVAGSVLHPVMARMQSDPEALRSYYYGSLKYCSLLMFGGSAAIAVMAEPLVHVLYTPKWYGMIVPMQLLALGFGIGTLNLIPGKLFKAINRTEILFWISLINLPFFVLLIWLAVPYGIEAVAFAQLILAALRFIPNYVMIRRVVKVNLRDTFRALMPGLFCAAAGALAGLLALEVETTSDLVRLCLCAAAFAAAHLVTLRLLSPEVLQYALRVFLRKARLV